MIKKTRNCIVCGTEYEYCGNCSKHASLPAWMAIYHDENCKTIMHIATEFMAGNLSKADAKIALDKCDLTHKKDFKQSVLAAINEIYTTDKPVKNENVKEAKKAVDKAKEA